MGLTFEVARFELSQRARRLSSLVYVLAFFAIALLVQLAAGGAFAKVSVGVGAGGKIFVNSPFQLHVVLAMLSYFGMIVTAVVFGQAACQDFETRSDSLFFTSRVSERSYLAGRFLGALGFTMLVHLALVLGLLTAALTPWVDHAQFEHAGASYYLWPYVSTILPNLVLLGALFFTVAVLQRRMMPVYVAAVVVFMGYLAGGSLMDKIEHRTLGALLDPFGVRAVALMTEYASVAEKNTRLVPLAGVLLENRLVWLAVAAALLAFTCVRFRFAVVQRALRVAPVEPEGQRTFASPRLHLGTSSFAHVLRTSRIAFSDTVRQPHFVVIVLAGMLFELVAASQSDAIFGTNVYPVTYEVLDVIAGTFRLFALVIATIYAGELVWRERDTNVDQIVDTMPTRTWVPFTGKLLALFAVQVVVLSMLMSAGLLFQTSKGYFHYELVHYAKELFGLQLISYCLLCALAMFVHTAVQQKYLGHLVLVVYFIAQPFLANFGLEHHLYKYGTTPSYEYSDMNGYGHLVRPVLWFDLYWALFAAMLGVASTLLWNRGTGASGHRLATARARFSPALRVACGLLFCGFAGVGGFIYWNTNVLNHYVTASAEEARQADYERTYRATFTEPQPRVVGVDLAIDLDPAALSVHVTGAYKLVNRTSQPITKVYVDIDSEIDVRKLSLLGQSPTKSDKRLGVYTIALPEPLQPGSTAPLEVDLFHATRGFRNGTQPKMVVGNGTFFSSDQMLNLGYQENAELSDEGSRKKLRLPPKERMRDLNDAVGRQTNEIGGDWIDFAATVSTSLDQIAIVPGYLQKEWTANGRRYFRYEMDGKMLNFFSVQSARYAVKHDRWKDVALEIYYHPGHEYDLDAMVRGMKAALDYYTTKFGPYPHHQLRILEFPRYQQFAQSFPNTIPYSESIGFIAKVDPKDLDDVDYPFYVTAHEVAHQWWAHQAIGANVQGATMLTETLSQYSALMVMKRAYGATKMKRFLRYELDGYLVGRSMERRKEMPLYRVEEQQYIHYRKGSLVMYALQDYLGEDVVDRVLAEYLAAVKYQAAPYAISTDLVERFRAAAPPELKYLVADLFEHITLYDDRATKATVTKRGERYDVTLELTAKKLRADDLGVESEQPFDDLVDVGALDDHGDAIFLEKRRLHAGAQTVTFTVDRLPAKVGVDPLNKLIDRIPEDNVVTPE